MIKKKIVFCGHGNINFHLSRFDLFYLCNFFQIIYFDCSNIIYSKKVIYSNLQKEKKKNKIYRIAVTNIKSEKDFIIKLNKIKPDFILDGLQNNFTKNLKKTIDFKFNHIIFNDGLVNWNRVYFSIFSYNNLKAKVVNIKYFLNYLFKLLSLNNKKYIYDIGFFAGEDSKKQLNFKQTKQVFWIGSEDYYKNNLKKSIKIEKKYITYIDSNFFLSPELEFASNSFNINFNNLKNHFRKSFEMLEKQLNLKVVVASHPNPKLIKRFDEEKLYARKIYHNKTVELIKKSKIVITDFSTAINLAVLNYKPIIIIYNNELKALKWHNNMLANYQLLNCNIFNSDQNNENFKINCAVNRKKYNKFIKLFNYNLNSHSKYKTAGFVKKYFKNEK